MIRLSFSILIKWQFSVEEYGLDSGDFDVIQFCDTADIREVSKNDFHLSSNSCK